MVVFTPTARAPFHRGRAATLAAILLALAAVATLASSCAPPGFRGKADFYVDDLAGDDGRAGTSPETAWKTLARLGAADFWPGPGSRILLRRGGTFRGTIKVRGGTPGEPIIYGAWGDPADPKPLIMGSIRLDSAWVDEGEGLWRYSGPIDPDPGNLYFFAGSAKTADSAWRRELLSNLAADLDFHYDIPTKTLRLRSTGGDPATRWEAVECALNRTMVDFSGQSWFALENLALRYGGGYAIKGWAAAHGSFRDLEVAWIGGGTKAGEFVRLGNGIEFWGDASDMLVERCRFSDIYDTGVDCQNLGAVCAQSNVVFHHNIIERCGLAAAEFWARPAGSSLTSIVFEHNTCAWIGEGWGYTQRDWAGTIQIGAGIVFFQNEASFANLLVRNNVFYKCRLVFMSENWGTSPPVNDALIKAATIDYNLWWPRTATSDIAVLLWKKDSAPYASSTKYSYSQIGSWRTDPVYAGKDAHSLVADPLFADEVSWRPTAASPARDAAMSTPYGGDLDFHGEGAPVGVPDIGAVEYR